MAKYQSQFVPTDFNTYGNILQMFRQDMGQRNQEFDQAKMMESQALAELYGTKTYDQETINKEVDRLKQQIDDSVKKKGMDYGAAFGDITSLIAKEKSNPIWGLNQRKVEQSKALQEMLDRNPNLKVLQDPSKISLTQKGLQADDIRYSVVDPEEYRKTLAQQTKGWDSKRTPLGIKNVNGYDVFQTQIGLSDQESNKLAMDRDNFMKSLSTMGNYEEIAKNPQVVESLYNDYVAHMRGLNQGVTQTNGMSPYQKLSMGLMRQEAANKQAELDALQYGNKGLPSPDRAIPAEVMFKNPDKLLETMSNPNTDKFTLNRANEIAERAIVNGQIKIPEKYIEKAGDRNSLELINDKINTMKSELKTQNELRGIGTTNAFGYNPSSTEAIKNITAVDIKELKELKKLRNNIMDAIDFELKLESSNFVLPIKMANPANKASVAQLKLYADNISPRDMIFITGENLKGRDVKDIQKDPEFESIQKGYTITGGGSQDEDGPILTIKANDTGKEYMIKYNDEEVNYQILNQIDSEYAATAGINQQYDFAQNILKDNFTGKEIEMPFKVKQTVNKGASGKDKRRYEIEGVTIADYYEKDIDRQEEEMTKAGYSKQQINSYFLQNYPEVFELKNGQINIKNTPFTTTVKRDIIDYYNKISQ